MFSVIPLFIISLFYSYAGYALYDKNFIILSPMVWYIITVLTSIICIVFSKSKYKYIDRNNIIFFLVWLFMYAALCVVSYYYSEQTSIQYRIFKNTVFLVIITIFFIPLIYVNILYILKGIYFVVLLSVLINIFELLFPNLFYFSVTLGRSAGFYLNPNNSALYIILGFILTVPVVNIKKRLYYSLFVMVGVFSTFSRAGFVISFLSVTWLIFTGYIKASKLATFYIILSTVVAITLMQVVLAPEGVTVDRYLKKDALIRIRLPVNDESIKGRLSQLNRGIDLMKESPIYGYGLGATDIGSTKVSPHNMFVKLGVEQGIIGIILYVTLLLYIFIMGPAINKLLSLVLFTASWFSHNIYDYPATWISVIIVLSTIYCNTKIVNQEDSTSLSYKL
jgi:O-antigen ligase